MTYFWYNLKLDLVKNKDIAMTLFNFATLEGKKKIINKLQKATNSSLLGISLIEEFNRQGEKAIYLLLLELLDHYYFFGRPDAGQWVIESFRHL